MAPRKEPAADKSAEMREVRLAMWKAGSTNAPSFLTSHRGVAGLDIADFTKDIGKRSKLEYTWAPMSSRLVNTTQSKDAKVVMDPDVIKKKVADTADYVGTYRNHHGVIRPEYDMLEPFTLVDTEAYLKQATNRRLALIMRNGYEIISNKRQDAADYIQRRLERMEYVTRRPALALFRDILTNLELCSNCFVLKIRDQKGAGVPKKKGEPIPVAGYAIIPCHQLYPYMEKGIITHWRRFYESGMPYQDYSLDDIIHFKWDCKPGHIYGTPRTVGVKDDIFAMRRLEENVELLFVNHLFPLFHIKIGTPDAPCTYYSDNISEIDMVKQSIETMPKEGVFVTDERVNVEVVGAKSHSLQPEKMIEHFKARVFAGLGVSPLDMGETDTSNRSTADSVSQVLKDSVKADLDTFSGQVRMFIFADLFQEANFSVSVQDAIASTHLKFHEIDMDNRIKEETHAVNMYNNHVITHGEARASMKKKPLDKTQEADTHYQRHIVDLEEKKAQFGLKYAVPTAGGKKKSKKAKGTKTKAAPKKKAASNVVQPSNQHGTKSSPRKNRSSLELAASKIYDRLLAALDLMDPNNISEWSGLSLAAITGASDELLSEAGEQVENPYTKQIRKGAARLKDLIVGVTDPDKIYTLVHNAIAEDIEDAEEQSNSTDNIGSDSVEENSSRPSDSGSDNGDEPESEDEDSDGS